MKNTSRKARAQQAPKTIDAVANTPAAEQVASTQTGTALAITNATTAAIAAIQHLAEHQVDVLAGINDGPVIDGEIITADQVGDLSDIIPGEQPLEDEGNETSDGTDHDESELDQADVAYEGDSLEAIADSIPEKDRKRFATKIGKAFDDRSAYETEKNKSNERIHKELDKSRAKLAMPGAAAVLLAAKVDHAFINRSVANGSRFNVYAADKLADLVKALQDGNMKNKVNIAVCKSMFRFRAAGQKFTGEMAKAAVCDKVKVDAAMAKLLVRHTVDPGTMSTQTSSTMTALQTLGIVKNTGSVRAPIYELTETPQTARLQAVMAA